MACHFPITLHTVQITCGLPPNPDYVPRFPQQASLRGWENKQTMDSILEDDAPVLNALKSPFPFSSYTPPHWPVPPGRQEEEKWSLMLVGMEKANPTDARRSIVPAKEAPAPWAIDEMPRRPGLLDIP